MLPIPCLRHSLLRFRSLFVALFGLLSVLGDCHAKPWHSIVPLHSPRANVRALLGSPVRLGNYTDSYELPTEIVEFMYAKGGTCGTTLVDSWRVQRNTVINVRAVPRSSEVTFRSARRFLRTQDRQEKNIFYYSDADEGVRYTVDNRADGEYVVSIDYLPAASDRYLSCSDPRDTDTQSVPVFEQYGVVSPDSEKAILDNFAIQLLENQDLTGYVVLRRGQYSSRFAAKKLRYIKNYLVNVRRVPANRMLALEGKPQRDFSVELYLVPKGKPGPT